jgi:alpha-1,2-mannosyltransferase
MAQLRALFGLFALPVLAITLALFLVTAEGDARILLSGAFGSKFQMVGRDFVNVWLGGHLAAAGDSATIYDLDAYAHAMGQALGIREYYNFSYPPHMLLAAWPFGLLPYPLALLLWTVLGAGLCVWAARPWFVDAGLPLWIVVLAPASLINIWAGHFGFLVAALALWGWRQVERSPPQAGAAFALMTIKPHLGVLVPLLLALRGRWAAFGWAAAFGIAMAAASVLVFGVEAWTAWLTTTLGYQASLVGDGSAYAFLLMMPTVERLAAALGLTGIAAIALQLLFGGAALLCLGILMRSGVALAQLGLASLVALPLLLPYIFVYDLVGTSLALLILMAKLQDRLALGERGLFALAFMIPVLQKPLALYYDLQIGPLAFLGVLLVLVRHRGAFQTAG